LNPDLSSVHYFGALNASVFISGASGVDLRKVVYEMIIFLLLCRARSLWCGAFVLLPGAKLDKVGMFPAVSAPEMEMRRSS